MEEGDNLPVEEALTEGRAPDDIKGEVLGWELHLAWSQKDLVLGSVILLEA